MSKPEYRVPSMAEVDATPSNGLSVVSTFSGCGGSCLGFRMAGYRILYANEFVEEARRTYAANASPDTFLDARDVREVSARSILEAIDPFDGPIDVLEGSPPCASFSTAGKRSEHWGSAKRYSSTSQRTDDLFDEYVRLVGELRPRAFVAENVSGLVKGVSKGYFKRVLAGLQAKGYRVSARLLDAQWLGVPQQRQRLIFVGLRSDVAPHVAPPFPDPLPYRYSLRDVLPHVVRVKRSGEWRPASMPAGAVQASGARLGESATFSGGEMVEVDISKYAIGREWDRLAPGQQSERYFNLVRPRENAPSPTITATGGVVGAAAVTHPTERRKFTIEELRAVCGFPADFELTGTYTQQWERLGRAVPPPMMAAVARSLALVLEAA